MGCTETAGGAARSAESMKPSRILARVAEELRRHGVRALVMPDYQGVPELYIREDDAALLDKLCDESRLSREARELLC